ncbi:MAG: helix-turn-helix transcriptional regulator [Clostridia bacterium]|nr:helix-turn-helix transcriptional regulator [Clostridia bacterium]
MNIGATLKELRKQANITQQSLSEKLCIAVRTLQCYEQGVREPSLEMLIKIADTLNVSTDQLLGRNIQE